MVLQTSRLAKVAHMGLYQTEQTSGCFGKIKSGQVFVKAFKCGMVRSSGLRLILDINLPINGSGRTIF